MRVTMPSNTGPIASATIFAACSPRRASWRRIARNEPFVAKKERRRSTKESASASRSTFFFFAVPFFGAGASIRDMSSHTPSVMAARPLRTTSAWSPSLSSK